MGNNAVTNPSKRVRIVLRADWSSKETPVEPSADWSS